MTELFEKYYNKEMDSLQAKDFESKLKQDPNFEQSYTQYKDMIEHVAIRKETNIALSGLRKVTENKRSSSTKSAKVRFIKPWMIAAAAVMIPIIYYFLLPMGQSPSTPQSLFADNFEVPMVSTTRGKSDDTDYNQMVKVYQEGDYKTVISMSNEMKIKDNQIESATLMICGALMARGEYSETRDRIGLLKTDERYINDFYWYSAMTYLAQGNVSGAKEQLSQIPNTSNYHLKSQMIISELN